MILPDKSIKLKYSLLNCGAVILNFLSKPQTINALWDRVRDTEELMNYEKFLLTLDFLFAIGAITFIDGMIERCNDDSLYKK
jgi:hypothetical protein